jgi:AraC-like DNA-binding protein
MTIARRFDHDQFIHAEWDSGNLDRLYIQLKLRYIRLMPFPGDLDAQCHYRLGGTYDRTIQEEYLVHRDYTEISYISWYIREGSLKVHSGGQQLQAGVGDWIFMDPVVMRSHAFSPHSRIISIRFQATWRGLDYLPPFLPPRVVAGHRVPAMLPAAEALCSFQRLSLQRGIGWSPSRECEAQTLLFGWLQHWNRLRESVVGLRPQAVVDPRVYEIIACLSERIASGSVDYSGLQQSVGLSRAQINRVFKEGTGLTPHQWVDARCLVKAEEMLRSGDLSVKEISATLGFCDPSHFTKWFRRKLGAAPTEWREHQWP